MILGNIISATLIRIAADAFSRIEQGGVWLVSGIIESNWPDVVGAANRAGFQLIEERIELGWVGAVLGR
jgi:ribosomal protein L11 methyltransferase